MSDTEKRLDFLLGDDPVKEEVQRFIEELGFPFRIYLWDEENEPREISLEWSSKDSGGGGVFIHMTLFIDNVPIDYEMYIHDSREGYLLSDAQGKGLFSDLDGLKEYLQEWSNHGDKG